MTGVALLLLTLFHASIGAGPAGRYLGLLAQYFPGYRVSAAGSLLGLGYGLVIGYALGFAFAYARNAALALYLTIVYGRAEKRFLRRLFDYM